jgi:hypothetical protein
MEIQAWHNVAPYPTTHPLATQNPKPTNHNLIVTHTTEQKILEHSTLNSNFTKLCLKLITTLLINRTNKESDS